ncbi:unnamed protein product, partial [Phaeothamnion confervicola]
CEGCGTADYPNLLLLCDNCDSEHHTYCLDPPLDSVPSGSWFCPRCDPEVVGGGAASSGDGSSGAGKSSAKGSSLVLPAVRQPRQDQHGRREAALAEHALRGGSAQQAHGRGQRERRRQQRRRQRRWRRQRRRRIGRRRGRRHGPRRGQHHRPRQ